MSRNRDVEESAVTATAVVSQISNALATNRGLDAVSRAVNSALGLGKSSVFGAVSIAVSDNPVATTLGVVAGLGVAVVGAPMAATALGGLTVLGISTIVSIAVDRVVRELRIGSSSATNPDPTPSSSVPDAPRPDQSPLSQPSSPSEGSQGSSTPPSSVPDAPRPDQSPWSQPANPSDGGESSSTPPSSVPDASRPDQSPWSAPPANPDPDNGGFDNQDKDGDGFYDGGGDGPDGGVGKPVVLDLDGDGVELIALEDSTAFYDIHGTGFRHHLSWVGADDGILAYDADDDGRISERGEISFVDYVDGARTDLEGLRHFDTNDDNQLTSADDEWSKFRVWLDLDGDGVSDPGELRTLDQAGIRSISLVASGGVETRADGTKILGRGAYTVEDGGSSVTRALADVALRVSPWGFRETADGVEIQWTDGEEAVKALIADSDAPLTLDLASSDYRSVIAGAGADRLSHSGSDTVMLAGMGGNDVLRGGAGGDLILGGEGNDTLYGGAGTDVLGGGAGADRIEGGAGDDLVHGGAGRDVLYGGGGDDTLEAGSNATGGWQELRGEAGNDTYLIGHGDGRVRIGSAAEGRKTGGADRVVFTDLALAEVEFTTADGGRSLVVRWTKEGVTGEVRIAEMGHHIERYEFADGSVLGRVEADWRARSSPSLAGHPDDRVWGTEGAEDIRVGAGAERVEGLGGADRIWGGAGADRLIGGAGADTLYGEAGDDVLYGEAGSDELHGGAGKDWLSGGEGDDVVSGGEGRDKVYGGAGDDTLDAGSNDGSGWQWMGGGAGDDTYRVSSSYGRVKIDRLGESVATGGADRVVFTDLALSEVAFSFETYRGTETGEDGVRRRFVREALVVRWTKDGESGRLWVPERGAPIERYEFADGSTVGRVEAQRLTGTDGADVIRTGSGDEHIDGGGGDDVLYGGEGDDTYEFSGRAFGRDRVSDAGGEDTLEFSGASWDGLWFSRTGDDLLVELMGSESEVTVEGWWSGSAPDSTRQVESIVAGDHTLAASAVQRLVQAMAGMDAPASGQVSLTATQREQMSGALAAWQEVAGS